jgi:hypothetical protein
MAIQAYSTNFGPLNKQYWGTAPPAAVGDGDFYQQGDVMWNTAPAAAGDPGWMCITSAVKGVDAGVWKAMANLDA